MHRIVDAVAEGPDKLRLTYADEGAVLVDFAPIIARGGVFAQLADPRFFAQVGIGEGGRFVEWPGEIDFCADALWLEASKPPLEERETVAVE